MKPVKLCTALAAALLLTAPLASFAQEAEAPAAPAAEEEESPISWSLTATSDYMFRGVSQTDEHPAGQAGITYTAPFGLYVGAWASNVDFGEGSPNIEYDTYLGFNTDLGESVNFDIMYNRYNYHGGDFANDLEYAEIITKTTFLENYSATVAFTNDIYNSSEDSWYYALGAGWDLDSDYSIGLNVGRTTFDESTGYEDYTDYGVTLGKAWGPISLSLGWIGTDSKGEVNFGKLAEDRAVLTLTYAP